MGVAPARIEAVVFDLLYTLTHPGTYAGGTGRIGWLAGILGLEEATLRARWNQFEPALESGHVMRSTGGLGPELDWVTNTAADLGLTVSRDDLARIEAGWDQTRKAALMNPPRDTLRTLTALRQRTIKLGVLSNTHALELRSWHESPLAALCDVASFSYEIGVCKPSAASYAHVLGSLGVPAASAAYVGDGSSNELAGAKSAGFGLVILAEEAAARSAPDDLPRLRAEADTAVTSLLQIIDLV